MRIVIYLALACAVLAAACWGLWRLWGAADDRADRAEHALVVDVDGGREIVKYVDRILKVPGPAVIRERLVRVCILPDLPGAGSADAEAGADAGDRPVDGAGALAADLAAAQRNKYKLEALQDVLRSQVGQ